MPTLRTAPCPRPRDLADRADPAVLYVRSYLLTRTVVGVLGVLLPVALVAGEAFEVPGPVQVRDSLSAYYSTPLRDLFVGSLCVIAVLLATYLAGQPRTWDFLLSLGAGGALLVVVAFPINRSGLPPGAPPCGSTPQPPGCSPVQQALGEGVTAHVHVVAAVAAFLALAALWAFGASWLLAGRDLWLRLVRRRRSPEPDAA